MKTMCRILLVLAGSGFAVTAAAQSLPEGAMIAWRPPLDAIDTAKKTVDIPRGWKVCDFPGAQSPGLYLKGVSADAFAKAFNPQDPKQSGLYGGSTTHGHTVTMEPTITIEQDIDKGSNKNAAGAGHIHKAWTDAQSNDPPFATVIWLCAKGDQAVAEFSSYGYGGNRITVARQGSGFSGAVPRSYVVCNTGPAPTTIEFRALPSRATGSGVKDGETMLTGECVGMDQPAWLRVTSVTGKDDISGNYYALRAGVFPKEGFRFKLGELDATIRKSVASGKVGVVDLDEAVAKCERLPEGSPLRKDFYSSCSVPLPGKGAYRLCFPKNFAIGAPDNYAFGNLRVIVDRKLIKSGFVGIPVDPSSAAPQGSCMDLWDVDAAIVLIWPAIGVPPSDPSAIQGARVSIKALGYAERSK